MTTTDTKRNYTAEETTAYETYLSALAEHNIMCARAGATTKQKMDAAFAVDRALKHFMQVAGHEPHSTRSPEDVRTIEKLNSEIAEQARVIRSAYSMLVGIHHIGEFAYHTDIDVDGHAACNSLLDDATDALRRALAQPGAA
ncbi:hypothetical protein JQK15_03815 [Sphingobium sp. BHU LFT2]|uniref:hypothetical protein n=1 Tax=Sphingobium sp. BHU LFT2 TaxID=2807634 RepID=UPI001BE9CC9D|nr:hypothetical protein [Sphingobium sp. BHU LFT2]MBT2242655.1 hypothetical protein [Sphingobium sp. BHU LFT2]